MENTTAGPQWPKSREEIWRAVFEPLVGRKGAPSGKAQRGRIPLRNWAALLLLLLLFPAIHYYTVTEETPRGAHAVVRLPDRSTVTLNAESKLSYKPCTWFVSRKVTLEGEACFEVSPGSRFSVGLGRNRVNVLGTTFNVYARAGTYRVSCLSGQVEVCAGPENLVLPPGMQAAWHGQAPPGQAPLPSRATAWMQGMFEFVETPLPEVIAEIERQYDVRVGAASGLGADHLYTGRFARTEKPEAVLEIIGKPFGITFSIE
jgi:ferric-dicitrate binding protein FerR (iron transport regulator)